MSPNPSGRPKRQFPRVDKLLKELGVEPITELIKLLPTLSDKLKVQVLTELLPYVHPKALPMTEKEHDELDDMSTDELLGLIKDKMREKAA